MSRLLITTPEFAVPAYSSPIAAPVLAVSHVAYDVDGFFIDAGDLIDPDISVLPDGAPMYTASYFGDYYNHIYVIPVILSLIDPPLDHPNKFLFWSTYFADATISGIVGTTDAGLTLSFNIGEPIGGIKLTVESISVGSEAPAQETAHYEFTLDNGGSTPWTVTLVETNLLAVPPETPVTELLKWKTDVISANDGTEQRIGAQQLARRVHQNNYLFLDDDEYQTIYDQLFVKLASTLSYPIWTEPTKLMLAVIAGDTVIQIDVTQFDVQNGDALFLDNEDGTTEQVKVNTVIGNLVTLSAGLINAWDPTNKVYRIAQVILPPKPALDRSPWAKISMKVDVTLLDFRTLFSGSVAPVEVGQETLLTDRSLTTTVPTLSGIPIINARPIITSDEGYKETFDWHFEISDYDIGTVAQLTTRYNAQVTYDRKFLTKNRTQRFYWNWMMEWMHGQRRPVWLPSWFGDFNTKVLLVSGPTVKLSGVDFLEHYIVESSNRGMWFTYNGGWFGRGIIAINASDDGNTLVTLSGPVPAAYPETGPFEDIGWLILARQASDEVQREIYPAYSMISTTFIGTKDSPETPT